jgi:hypothetical protein
MSFDILDKAHHTIISAESYIIRAQEHFDWDTDDARTNTMLALAKLDVCKAYLIKVLKNENTDTSG